MICIQLASKEKQRKRQSISASKDLTKIKRIFIKELCRWRQPPKAACAVKTGTGHKLNREKVKKSPRGGLIMNAKRLLKVATVFTVAAAGLMTAAPVANAQNVPPIMPPVSSLVYADPGAVQIAVGPDITVTLQTGNMYHMNLSCQGCERGVEVNYAVKVSNSMTLRLNGSVWQYLHEPVRNDGLCDDRDTWPTALPAEWSKLGALMFPCGSVNGQPTIWTPDMPISQTVQAAAAPMANAAPAASVDCAVTQSDQTNANMCTMLSMYKTMMDRLDAIEAKMAQQPVQQPNRNAGKPNTGKPAAGKPSDKTVTNGMKVAQGENQTYILKAGKGYHLNAWWPGDGHEYNYLFTAKEATTLSFSGTLMEFDGIPAKSVLPAASEKEVFPKDLSKLPALQGKVTLL